MCTVLLALHGNIWHNGIKQEGTVTPMKGGVVMSDFEILSLMISILTLVISILLHYIDKTTKK